MIGANPEKSVCTIIQFQEKDVKNRVFSSIQFLPDTSVPLLEN